MDLRPELRRTMTLSEPLSTPDPAIREFLRIPNDGSFGEADAEHGDQDGDRTAGDGGDSRGMSNWKPLRDRLRLRRAINAWPTPSPKPATTNSTSSRSNKYIYAPGEAAAAFSHTGSLLATPTFSRVTSTRVGPTSTFGSIRRAAARDDDEASEHDDDEHDEEEEEGKEAAPAAQMSLMALLEQTDSQWDDDDEEDDHGGGGTSKNAHADDDDDDGEGREEEMVHVCCVCMVRHKGAAFIPCGHTFCRLCSRELWVSRDNCPLCNGFIQEILDIF